MPAFLSVGLLRRSGPWSVRSPSSTIRCIPTVRDRVAQEVLRRLLEPLFEPLFHPDSYGFRPGRSCHLALRRVLELKRREYRQVLDADISGFFDNLAHAVIVRGLTNVVADGTILSLVEKFLKAGVLEEGVVRATTVGTPQGGVLSPLLANIALNFLDWHLDACRLRFVRYADDCAPRRREGSGTGPASERHAA